MPNISQILPDPKTSLGAGKAANIWANWATISWTLPRALKTYQFWLVFLVAFLTLGTAGQIVIVHQVYSFRNMGYNTIVAPTTYSIFGVAFVLGSLSSFLSDRLGREKVFITGCVASGEAVFLLFFLKDASQLLVPFLFSVLFRGGVGVLSPVFFSTVAHLFRGKYFCSVRGTVFVGFSLGGAIGSWLGAFIHDKANSYFAVFLLVMGSLVTSALLMYLIAPPKIKSEEL